MVQFFDNDHRDDHNDDRDPLLSGAHGSSSSDASSLFPIADSSTRRIHSCCNGIRRCRSNGAADAYKRRHRHHSSTPDAAGYVSLEDVMGSMDDRPPAELVRVPSHPRHRRRSPGPLGTRRGSAMHRFVNKYVAPCLALVARAFVGCCMPGVPAR